jgi:hypothetical protein
MSVVILCAHSPPVVHVLCIQSRPSQKKKKKNYSSTAQVLYSMLAKQKCLFPSPHCARRTLSFHALALHLSHLSSSKPLARSLGNPGYSSRLFSLLPLHRASNCTILTSTVSTTHLSIFPYFPPSPPTLFFSRNMQVYKEISVVTYRFVLCLYNTRCPQFLHRIGSPRLRGTS